MDHQTALDDAYKAQYAALRDVISAESDRSISADELVAAHKALAAAEHKVAAIKINAFGEYK